MKRANIVPSSVCHRPRQAQSQEEPYRGKKQTSPGTVADMLVKHLGNTWLVKAQEDESRNQQNRQAEPPGSLIHENIPYP